MGIVQAAKLDDRRISSKKDLYEKQVEMLRIIYEHNAISEEEYKRSVSVLTQRMTGIAS